MFEPEEHKPDEACATECRLTAELAECAAELPGSYYMDPPDGGDVTVSEQLRRMAKDAARYVWLRDRANWQQTRTLLNDSPGNIDAAIDAAMNARSARSIQDHRADVH